MNLNVLFSDLVDQQGSSVYFPTICVHLFIFTDLISELISAEQPGALPGPRPPPADLLSDHSQHGRMQRQTSPQSSRPVLVPRGAAHVVSGFKNILECAQRLLCVCIGPVACVVSGVVSTSVSGFLKTGSTPSSQT